MKRMMMTVAAVALTAGMATADGTDKLRSNVELQIDQYAPNVAVETLTDDQVKQIYLVLSDSSSSAATKSGAIEEIIEGSAAEKYAEMMEADIDLTLEPATMREQLQAKLDIRGFDHDVSTLSDEEVAELAAAFNNGDTPAEIEAAVNGAFEG